MNTFFVCFIKLELAEGIVRRCSVKKVSFMNFTKLTGKHLCQRLFLNKVTCLAFNFIKKETLVQVFSCEFCEIFKYTFFSRTPLAAASELIEGEMKFFSQMFTKAPNAS